MRPSSVAAALLAAVGLPLLSACATVTAQTSASTSSAAADPHLEIARRVLRAAPLVDGHNDLPWAIRESATAPHDVVAYDLRTRTAGHTDLPRLAAGMVGGQFWSVYVPSPAPGTDPAASVTQTLEQIDVVHRMIARYPDRLTGWTQTTDMNGQVRLTFDTQEEAVAFAQAHGISFQLLDAKPAKRIIKAYADNFAYGRKVPWTH